MILKILWKPTGLLMSRFSKLINNKKVLLLGPAPHVFDPENTKDFEDFDVIVKVNKMVEKAEFEDENLNNRTDVLYHCMQIDLSNGDDPYSVEEWSNRGVKHVRMPFVGPEYHYKKNNNRFLKINSQFKIEFSLSSVDTFSYACEMCGGTLPSTGVLAINDLVQQNPLLLDIRGFTFGKTGYSKNYKNERWHNNKENRERTTKHRVDEQIKFVRNILKENNNIIIDKEMENSIS